jgi:hypothetical protein
LLEQIVGVACLRRGRQVALVAAVFRLLVITSPVVMTIVISTATSVIPQLLL